MAVLWDSASPVDNGDEVLLNVTELTENLSVPSTQGSAPSDVLNLYRLSPDKPWTKQIPKDLTEPVESLEPVKSPLIVRWTKGEDARWQARSFTLQSEEIRQALTPAFAGYSGITMTLETLTFEYPYVPFVRQWQQFCQTREDTQNPTIRSYLDLLHQILDNEVGDILTRRADLLKNGVITHDLLWTVFIPQTVLFSAGGRHPSGVRDGFVEVKTRYIDYDGEKYHYENEVVNICPFKGTMALDALQIFPPANHQDAEAMRQRLIDRGNLWESYDGSHYKHVRDYGRVMIDPAGYRKHHNSHMNGWETGATEIATAMTDEHRLLATPWVRGFSLRKKEWRAFMVDEVEDIAWNKDAFDSLVLPRGQQDLKKLILAVAKAQSQDSFDDVVQGKGQSVNLLLSGPPGVVLLIDEADVFLEARTVSDLARNELVSIFLRKMEYYEGILFLTSNRAENIDPAFDSRIHISLLYPDLDAVSRRQIWAQFLPSTADITEAQLDSLAELELNGRQIKNLLKTAHLLARDQERGLLFADLETVVNLRSLGGKPSSIWQNFLKSLGLAWLG
ncbi:P-loop containing nucleoside triphosphate hydrolase protein [Aspergillus brunneoviolaceus CBS 621.78]|uniref:P-loop containing nucleoside triphosphate hydrolase protein n=1 Tax=Aspergillus brunneoviolaceus CBS 621.78 TaxID=1450534 RepID=A0ACD1GHW6_9EURO|nr:P-loop containing nucleoside triphosphate hydrolase protein [Aspergillus brunneoviolaceus CBS 621.78]RAH48812.1 P-loop containing nucleoside triphosphate hydrolase protein [Aspergillus brunneoviolaceus CBS 621.78]